MKVMANKLHDLTQTRAEFQLRGLVTGMKSKNGNKYNSLYFGLRINKDKIVNVKLNGFTRNEVYFYKQGENGEKGKSLKVAWKDRKKTQPEGYRLIGVNISTDHL